MFGAKKEHGACEVDEGQDRARWSADGGGGCMGMREIIGCEGDWGDKSIMMKVLNPLDLLVFSLD